MALRSPPRHPKVRVAGVGTNGGAAAEFDAPARVYRGAMADNALDRAGEARLYRALRRFWHPVMWADELAIGPSRHGSSTSRW